MKFQQGLLEAGITEPENLANELEYMFQYRLSQEETGEVWQNLYQEQMQHQNAGEDSTFKYTWMFLRSEINDMDEQFQNGQSEEQGQQNSFNDHPNGGNQGDNENGENGGQGGNGSGGK